jgi:hypothetical protein
MQLFHLFRLGKSTLKTALELAVLVEAMVWLTILASKTIQCFQQVKAILVMDRARWLRRFLAHLEVPQ